MMATNPGSAGGLGERPSAQSEAEGACDKSIQTIATFLAREAARGLHTTWLCIELPAGELEGPCAQRLRRAGFCPTEDDPRILLRKTPASGRALAHMIEATLGAHSHHGLRMCVVQGDEDLDFDLVHGRLKELDPALDRLKAEWLIPVLVGRRVFVEFMPMFDEKGTLFADEALARGTTATHDVVSAIPLFMAGRALGLATEIDRLAHRAAVLEFMKRRGSTQRRLAIHVTCSSLVKGSRAAASLLESSRTHGLDPADVIAIVRPDCHVEVDLAIRGVEFLEKAGFEIWLGGLDSAEHTLAALHALRPKVARITLPQTLNYEENPNLEDALLATADQAAAIGTTLAVTGIETPDHLALARTLGATYFSGRMLTASAASDGHASS
ncbi:MAG: EAL domain-containing protein [Polyangiaceae bacterium]